MSSTRCCEPLCQHPGCWISGKIEMVEAYRRYALADVGRSYKSLQPSEDRTISEREQGTCCSALQSSFCLDVVLISTRLLVYLVLKILC